MTKITEQWPDGTTEVRMTDATRFPMEYLPGTNILVTRVLGLDVPAVVRPVGGRLILEAF